MSMTQNSSDTGDFSWLIKSPAEQVEAKIRRDRLLQKQLARAKATRPAPHCPPKPPPIPGFDKPQMLDLDWVLEAVSYAFDLPIDYIKDRERTYDRVKARAAFSHIAIIHTKRTQSDVARYLKLDHSSVRNYRLLVMAAFKEKNDDKLTSGYCEAIEKLGLKDALHMEYNDNGRS